MQYWIRVAGTGRSPIPFDDWRGALARWEAARGPGGHFSRRPTIRAGDRLVVYAARHGRIFRVEEATADPLPCGHERWPWRVPARELCAVPHLSLAPFVEDIGVPRRSISQHSHIRITEAQGRHAEELLGCDSG